MLTEDLTGAAVVSLLTAKEITYVTWARFFVNGVKTRTQGVDEVGSYRVPNLGFGRIVLTGGFNYNDTRITSRAYLPSLPGVLLFGRRVCALRLFLPYSSQSPFGSNGHFLYARVGFSF